ncbi:MAG: hypothetical protein FJX65_02200 [Alphaproteobacteria bacterium]|nr:hypothetical protein [Alphaproteobacteria bacterium]
MTRRHVYPLRSLIADDLRALAGLLLTAGPLFLAALAPVVAYVLSGLSVLFLVFAIKALLRHTTAIEIGEGGVEDRTWPGRTIRWEDLAKVQLRYFSTRRDREAGWMTLRLAAPGARITIESTIEGFEDILRSVARESTRQTIEFSASTRANFEQLGIRLS